MKQERQCVFALVSGQTDEEGSASPGWTDEHQGGQRRDLNYRTNAKYKCRSPQQLFKQGSLLRIEK